MAKKDKAKKAKCPKCKVKLIKVRNKQERYCLECGYIEPIPVPDKKSKTKKGQSPQSTGELQEGAILASPGEKTFIGKNAVLEVNGQEITLTKIPIEPAPVAKTKAQQQKEEREHIARIKRRRADGGQVSRGLMAQTKVMVHCWSRGQLRGYAYGTVCPYPNPVWSQAMSGVEAFQFLTKVKRANTKNKLESGAIMRFNED